MSTKLIVEPPNVQFSDVHLNQSYLQSITVTNPLTAAVQFTVSCSSTRLKVKPDTVNLQPGQSIVLTVSLFLNHYPDLKKGIKGQRDTIGLHSTFSDQNIPVQFALSQATERQSQSVPSSPNSRFMYNHIRKTNASPARKEANEIVSELSAQIKVKEHRINELETIIGGLKSRHPEFERVLEKRLAMKDEEMEEKSEKIIKIMQAKDRELSACKAELKDVQQKLLTQKELNRINALETSKQEGDSHWRGAHREAKGEARGLNSSSSHSDREDVSPRSPRSSANKSFSSGAALRDAQLEIEQLKYQLDEERKTNKISKVDQDSTIQELQRRLSNRDANPSSMVNPSYAQSQELRSLREQNQDFSTQVKQLTAEVTQHRQRAQELEGNVSRAKEDLVRLQGELSAQQHKYEDLHAAHQALQRSYDETQQNLLLSELAVSRAQNNNAANNSHPHHQSNQRQNTTAPHVSWQRQDQAQANRFSGPRDSTRYEPEVGSSAGLNTSTPTYFGLTSRDVENLSTQEKNNMIAAYQDRLQQSEEELQKLRSMLSENRNVENNLRQRTNELEARTASSDQDGRVQYEKAERLRSSLDEANLALKDKEIQLQSALSKLAAKDSDTHHNDAHVWWSYVWHEARKQQQQNGLSGLTGGEHSSPGDLNYTTGISEDAKATFHINKLRDNLRGLAVEVASLRQARLGDELTYKQQLSAVKSELEARDREVVNLETALRIHKGDKDMKIAELSATVRSLASKSDMHAQLASARQDVETEKLTNHHLRADVDAYRNMLETEQQKVQTTRTKMSQLQATLDAMEVYKTVMHVPGVDPMTLIETMSGRINQLQSEVSRCKASLSDAVLQVKTLQHTASLTAAKHRSKDDLGPVTPNRTSRSVSGGLFSGADNKSRNNRVARSLSPSGRSPKQSEVGIAYDELLRASTSSRLRDSTSKSPRLALLRPNTVPADATLDDTMMDDETAPFSHSSPQRHVGLRRQSSFGSSSFDGTSGSFSVVVDAETTPKMLLDSFDVAVLVQRVKTQDATIAELQLRVDDLTETSLQNNREALLERDNAEYGDRMELDNALRRYELLSTQYEESRDEVATLRDKAAALEKALSERHLDKFLSIGTAGVDNNTSILHGLEDELPLLGQHNSADLSSTLISQPNVGQYEQSQKELEEAQTLLRERTTQLKVLMETLESLQLAGVSGPEHVGTGSDHASFDEDEMLFAPRSQQQQRARKGARSSSGLGLSDLASMNVGTSMPSLERSWGSQALVKRVVDLTTQLASQCAAASLEDRRASEAESNSKRKSKEINRLKALGKKTEEEVAGLRQALTSATTLLKDHERDQFDALAALRRENEDLSSALRETECTLSNAELRITELTEQVRLVDQADFHTWLEMIALDSQKILTTSFTAQPENYTKDLSEDPSAQSPESSSAQPAEQQNQVFAGKNVHESSVRELVVALVGQWKEFVGNVPANKLLSSGTATISKAEQRFLQRVTDLVMNANERATMAAHEMHNYELQSKRSEMMARISGERLEMMAQHLNRYRKRCQAYENVINSDAKYSANKRSKLEALLRKALKDERAKRVATNEALRTEHRDHQIIEIKRLLESNKLRKLQAQVAEYESRGSATLQGRVDAISSVDDKLRDAEYRLTNWFKVELPRLVSGLPVTEDAFSEDLRLHDLYSGNSASDGVYERKQDDISQQLIASLGLDRTYALSQALCSSKATQTAQEKRIAVLMEKLSIQKERNQELEGVLIRWKDQVNESLHQQHQLKPSAHGTQVVDVETRHPYTISKVDGSLSNIDSLIQQVYSNAEVEKSLSLQIAALQERLMELEEDNIEAKGRLEHANSRAQDMKAFADSVTAEKNDLKSRATHQITKIRVDLENEHAAELRRLRQSYESDKRALIAELEKVSRAVEEAHLTTVEPYAWQRLIKGSRHDGEVKIASGSRGLGLDDNSGLYEDILLTSLANDVSSDSLNHQHQQQKSQHRSQKRVEKKEKSSRRDDRAYHSPAQSESDSSSEDDDQNNDHPADRHPVSGAAEGETLVFSDPFAGHADLNASHDHRLPVAATTAADKKKVKRGIAEKKGSKNKKSTSRHTTRREALDYSSSSPSSTISSNSDNRDVAKQVEVERLERMLDMERRRNDEAQHEMQELETLLSVQKSLIESHLDKSSQNLSSTANDTFTAQADGRHKVAAASIDQQPASEVDNETSRLESGIQREDAALWPSPATLADELLSVLQSLSTKYRHTAEDNLVRTAMSMAARVKAMASGSQQHRSQLFDDRRDDFDYHSSSVDVSGPLRSLVSRVQRMESDFHDDNVPEKHLHLLRALRKQVVDIERTMSQSFERQRRTWTDEREELTRSAQETQALHEELRTEHDQALSSMRRRYEEANRGRHNAEEALEQHTEATRNEIQRLQSEIHRLQSYLQQRGGDQSNVNHEYFQQLESRHSSETHKLKTNFNRFRRAQEEIVRCLEDQLEEAHGLGSNLSTNSLLFETSSHNTGATSLEEAQDKIRRLDFKYRTKSLELEAALRSLAKSADMEDDNSIQQQRGPHRENDDLSVMEAPDVRGLAPAAQRRTSVSGIAMALNVAPPDSVDDEMDRSYQQGTGRAHASTNAVQSDIHEARLLAAETEIEALHRNLTKERKVNQDLRTALHTTLEKQNQMIVNGDQHDSRLDQRVHAPPPRTQPAAPAAPPTQTAANATSSSSFVVNDAFLTDYGQEFVVPEGEGAKEKIRQQVKRSNTLAKHARTEISRLKDHIIHLQDEATGARGEITKQRAAVLETKNQLVQAREDSARKAKLLATLKASKAADLASLEQWKAEAGHLDEQNKRHQKSIAEKNSMINRLKEEKTALETELAAAKLHVRPVPAPAAAAASNNALNVALGIESAGGVSSDIVNLSVHELRARLKSSELERNRSRQRVQALKERVAEVETELKTLQEECDKLRKVGEKTESLRTTLSRKDQQISGLRTQIDRLTGELAESKSHELSLREEFERKISTLQRQTDNATRSLSEYQKENQLMRERVHDAEGQRHLRESINRAEQVDNHLRASIHNATAAISAGNSGTNNSVRFQDSRSVLQQSYPPASATSGSGAGVTAQAQTSSQGGDVNSDLQDMMSALGVNPRSLGVVNRHTASNFNNTFSSNANNNTSRAAKPAETQQHTDYLNTTSSTSSSVDTRAVGESSVEKRLKALVSSALQSPTRQRRL